MSFIKTLQSLVRPQTPRYLKRSLTLLGFTALSGFGCGVEPSVPLDERHNGLVIPLSDCFPASLATAITNANAAGEGPHTITLKSGCTYTFTQPNNYWYGPNALPPITSDITIDGTSQGATIERVAADTVKFRLFYVAGNMSPPQKPGKLTLRKLTLRGGLARGGNGGNGGGAGGLGAGGAIFAQGSVTLNSVTLSGNTAQGGSGGAGTGTGAGGGIGGNGASALTANGVGGGGGGMKDDGQAPDGTAGKGGAGGGGPVGNEGGQGVTLTAAGAGGTAAGSENGGPGTGAAAGGPGGGTRGLGGLGGGTTNVTLGDGGGGGQSGVSGGGGGAGYGGSGGIGGASLSGVGGGGGGFGGGGGGGGAMNGGGGGGGVGGGGGGSRGGGGFGGGGASGSVGGNGGFGGGGGGAANGGVGVAAPPQGSAGFGGGDGSTVGGGGGAGLGGAVFLMYGTLNIINSTLANNTARGGVGGIGGSALGGAVFNLNGTVALVNATLAKNFLTTGTVTGTGAPSGRADGFELYNLAYGNNNPTASVTLQNSIIASLPTNSRSLVNDRQTGTATVTATGPNIVMTSLNLGNATSTGSPAAVSPMLAELADNGGPAQTLLLIPTSPAINAGDTAVCAGTLVGGVDERGQSRACGCDIGAFQSVPNCPQPDMAGTSDMGTSGDLGPAVVGQLGGGGFDFGCSTTRTGDRSGPVSLLALLLALGLSRRRLPLSRRAE